MDLIAKLQAPVLLVLMILFRAEIGIPEQYGIREADMEYYLWFGIIVTAFQLIADLFILSSIEIIWGIKVHDYLVFARYRFLKRETRWKGMDGQLDDVIDPSMQALDGMCFSSQYYFMTFAFSQGMFFLLIGIIISNTVAYNMFADPVLPLLVLVLWLLCSLVERAFVFLGDRIGMWRLRDASQPSSAWTASFGNGSDAQFGVPGATDLEKLKAMAAAASREHFLMNQRITSETFRFKFLEHNREWLAERLPQIFTPRTLKRTRPFLLAQFAKLLGLDEDDSSEGEAAGGEGGKKRPGVAGGGDADAADFGDVDLSGTSTKIMRNWLGAARKQIRVRKAVVQLID
ncbi:MAG: hypothetical protein EOO65_05985, partial [Methanosarcinales archaeon]